MTEKFFFATIKERGEDMAAVAVLLAGLAIGIAAIVRVQKKYNGGVF